MGLPKTVLVTGGAQRVGRSICLAMAEAGYAVAVHFNSSQGAADELVAQIDANGGRAASVGANLANTEAVRALMGKATDALGTIGILVNNASTFVDDGFDVSDEAKWDTHFAVHVKSPAVLTSALYEQLPDDAEGLVVNIIDQRVLKVTPKFPSYTLSKSALWTATRTMAQAFGPKLRVNAIGPGPTLPSSRQSQESFQQQVDATILKRTPDLGEFAKTILYFAEARSVTGQMIALDSGQHLAWETPDHLAQE
ncbi:MAG: SDR family oxidoreductase [Ahrensia sp.]|nr:SDR family oxidoreductase [Ahrensia sp.]